jgi:8-oxo-dGTP diphosphatase
MHYRQISRYGAYGVLVKDSKVLLSQKKSGPFQGLWDFPGGGIEFKETPEEALKREFLEETALRIDQFRLVQVISHFTEYHHQEKLNQFHLVGIIYQIDSFTPMPQLIPEEELSWATYECLDPQRLTPLVNKYLSRL